MNASDPVEDPVLERQGKRMIGPAIRFLVIAAVMAVAGIATMIVRFAGVRRPQPPLH